MQLRKIILRSAGTGEQLPDATPSHRIKERPAQPTVAEAREFLLLARVHALGLPTLMVSICKKKGFLATGMLSKYKIFVWGFSFLPFLLFIFGLLFKGGLLDKFFFF